jgi:hypothetical protein
MKNLARILLVLVLAACASASPAASRSGSPIVKGGNFGLGLIIGGPGDWGATGKVWLSRATAFQAVLNLDDALILQGDFLWHHYGVIQPSRGAWPVYLGVGGAVLTEGDGGVAIRGPVGMDYIFDTVPVDLFVELAPYLWFFEGDTDLKLRAGVGARYFF